MGSLAEAVESVKNIATLLRSLDTANVQPARRDTLRAMRDRLDAGCKARFALGLQDDLLMPLYRLGSSLDAAAIAGLEATARGLRVLETEARTVGSSAVYDLLLSKAAAAIENRAPGGILPVADQVRLVEILAGPEAALALIGRLA